MEGKTGSRQILRPRQFALSVHVKTTNLIWRRFIEKKNKTKKNPLTTSSYYCPIFGLFRIQRNLSRVWPAAKFIILCST